MYVVTLSYTAPIEQVDALIPEHREWLDTAYADGLLLASGAKVPRDGGILIAPQMERAALDALLADDPFAKGGVARYDVVEFRATKTASALVNYREEQTS
ncbi:YciI family protein [Streptacidiphilus monticola]|uniref:YciI family protein n=1 Tax=Streptacidiphilus monticola TaxID=2161674 RepID=A0ABW1G451_9ACTN